MITLWKTPVVATVEQIVKDLKLELYGTGLLKEVNNTGSDLMCTCPFHGGGKEHNPSLGILLREKKIQDKSYEAGTAHCFTCGYTADLPQFVADLLGLENSLAGFKWIVGRYNYSSQEREPIDLNLFRGSTEKRSYMDEREVQSYYRELRNSEEALAYLHKRRLSAWVIERYELGFDPADKTVLFPVRDLSGKVIFYKGRSLVGKHFYNAKDIDKSSLVFGLYELTQSEVQAGEWIWIVESEIDALSLISKHLHAIAIMGSHISDEQCKELERSPFRKFVLATDNDEAGRKGATQIKRSLIKKGFRFQNLRWNTEAKDVNELIQAHGDSWMDYLTGF